jgi:hypothetical protein
LNFVTGRSRRGLVKLISRWIAPRSAKKGDFTGLWIEPVLLRVSHRCEQVNPHEIAAPHIIKTQPYAITTAKTSFAEIESSICISDFRSLEPSKPPDSVPPPKNIVSHHPKPPPSPNPKPQNQKLSLTNLAGNRAGSRYENRFLPQTFRLSSGPREPTVISSRPRPSQAPDRGQLGAQMCTYLVGWPSPPSSVSRLSLFLLSFPCFFLTNAVSAMALW